MKAVPYLLTAIIISVQFIPTQTGGHDEDPPLKKVHGKIRCSTFGKFIGLSGLPCNLKEILKNYAGVESQEIPSLLEKATQCLEHPRAFERSCKEEDAGGSLFPTLV